METQPPRRYRKLRIAWSVRCGLVAQGLIVLMIGFTPCSGCKERVVSSPSPYGMIPIPDNKATLSDYLPKVDELARVTVTIDLGNQGESAPRLLPKEKWESLISVFDRTRAHQCWGVTLPLMGNLELVRNDGTKAEVWLYGGLENEVIFLPHDVEKPPGVYFVAQITDDPIWSNLPIYRSPRHSNLGLRVAVMTTAGICTIAWLLAKGRFTIRSMLVVFAVFSFVAAVTLYVLGN